tara:strand:+ start:459 stop:668 length:210 start_codon:yes stop_codon:yes gene_type:complete
MSMKLGDVDVAQEIIELRHQLSRTQMILELVINKNTKTLVLPNEQEMKEIDDKAIDQLIKRFPNSVSRK